MIGEAQTRYNHLTHCYETSDGTVIAAEVADNCDKLLDFIYIAILRDAQRAVLRNLRERKSE